MNSHPQSPGQDKFRKVGLALSGGGFRASFFHVGVLAGLARLGLLRHVEVLSVVSGGAIIGALYYLHLKRLMERKRDEEITDGDYVAVVQSLETDFFRAVQRNFRARTFLNPFHVLKTCLPWYSRTDQFGYLLDEVLYRPAFDPDRRTPVEMRELLIRPAGEPQDFFPPRNNRPRHAKVPVLLINATVLNNGRPWRFEASTMGEYMRSPAKNPASRFDRAFRLARPGSYDEVAQGQQNVELGLAVAASACVPGLLPPLALSGMYAHGVRVQLVDGGVHDNQGVQGLLDTLCTHLIVSDAAQQLPGERDPAAQLLPLLQRASDVLISRLRLEQLVRLLENSGKHSVFLHLRRGAEAGIIPWIDRDGRPARVLEPTVQAEPSFGVDTRVQLCLAGIRTDLTQIIHCRPAETADRWKPPTEAS